MNRRRKIISGILGDSSGWSNYNATNNKAAVAYSTDRMLKVAIVGIDDTRALLVYSLLVSFTTHCYARVFSIDANGDITLGDQVELTSTDITFVDAKLINSTQILIACGETQIDTFVVTISGLTFADVGVTTTFATGVTLGTVKLAVISPTQFFVAYEDTANEDTIVAYGSISGTIIASGNNLTLLNTDTDALVIEPVSTGKAIAFYNNKAELRVDCKLLSVTGTTPTVDDTEVDIVRVGEHNTNVATALKITDNKILFTYRLDATEDTIESFFITVVNDAIVLHNTAVISTGGDPEYITTTVLNDTQCLVVAGLGTTGGISSKVVDIYGVITYPLTSYSIVSGDKEEVTSATLGDNVVVTYRDDNDFLVGKLLVVRP